MAPLPGGLTETVIRGAGDSPGGHAGGRDHTRRVRAVQGLSFTGPPARAACCGAVCFNRPTYATTARMNWTIVE